MIQQQTNFLTQRLDNLPFSRWHFFMVLALGTIWIFDGYEVSLISLFSHYIIDNGSEDQFKAIVTSYQIGCILGSIGFGFCAYFYGRRVVFMITLAIYAVGIVLSMLDSSFIVFALGRLLTGISVGGQFTSIFSAIDEFLPPNIRGRVDIAIDGTWHLGGSIAAILNIIVGQVEYWRLLFGVGLFGIFAIVCLRKNIPQSPRWLLLQNRRQEARRIIYSIEQCVHHDETFLKENCNNERYDQYRNELDEKESVRSEKEEQYEERKLLTMRTVWIQIKLIGKRYKLRLLVSVVLIFSQAFYFNSVYYKFPINLKNKYDVKDEDIPLYMLPLSITSFLSTLLVGQFFDKFGRPKMVLVTYCLSGILLALTLIANTAMQFLLLTIFMFIFSSPAASSANLIASEIFPTSTRSVILSFIFIFSMIGGLCGVWQNQYIFSIILMILSGIIGYFLCPNAQNKSLQEINNLVSSGKQE